MSSKPTRTEPREKIGNKRQINNFKSGLFFSFKSPAGGVLSLDTVRLSQRQFRILFTQRSAKQ